MRFSDNLNFDQNFIIEFLTDLQFDANFNVSQIVVYDISDLMNITFTNNMNVDVYDIDSNYIMKINYTFRHQYNFACGNAFWCYNVVNVYVTESDEIEYIFITMQNLHYSQNLNVTFATFAKSMTNSIRKNSDDNFVMTDQTDTLHVMYQIRWKYLILSIFLIFVNVIFFIIVIFHTRKSNLTILCSNAISTFNFENNIEFIFKKNKIT